MKSTSGVKGWVAGSAALLLPVSLQAAQYPDTSAFANAPQVSDEVLGEMRGRFVSGSRVLYFGVEMLTEWRNTAGEIIAAGANFSIDLSSGTPVVTFLPTVSIVESEGGTLPAGGGHSFSINGSGLNNPAGVVQAAQVAGDGNQVDNAMEMNIKFGPVELNSTGTVALESNNTSLTGASGATATVLLDSKSLKVMITTPGSGQTLQSIGGGQAMQQAMVMGNSLQVSNFLDMKVHMGSTSGFDSATLKSTLQHLQGISMPGGF